MNLNYTELQGLIEHWKLPVAKCPICGGPLETVEHEEDCTYSAKVATNVANMFKSKDDPPDPIPEKHMITVKSALCRVCWWESPRSEPCCEEHGG
jgi:hypothetical protein